LVCLRLGGTSYFSCFWGCFSVHPFGCHSLDVPAWREQLWASRSSVFLLSRATFTWCCLHLVTLWADWALQRLPLLSHVPFSGPMGFARIRIQFVDLHVVISPCSSCGASVSLHVVHSLISLLVCSTLVFICLYTLFCHAIPCCLHCIHVLNFLFVHFMSCLSGLSCHVFFVPLFAAWRKTLNALQTAISTQLVVIC